MEKTYVYIAIAILVGFIVITLSTLYVSNYYYNKYTYRVRIQYENDYYTVIEIYCNRVELKQKVHEVVQSYENNPQLDYTYTIIEKY